MGDLVGLTSQRNSPIASKSLFMVLVVLGWWDGLERIEVVVLIAVRSGVSCRWGRPVLVLRGLPLSETKDLFFSSLIFYFLYAHMYQVSRKKRNRFE